MTELLTQNKEPITHPTQEVGQAVLALESSPRVARANEIAATIDPGQVLPEVEIVPDPNVRVGRGSLVPQKSLIMYSGQKIGECTVVSNNKDRARWFNGVEVDEKGKGYGSAAYKAAITQAMLDGYDFRTHEWSQTEGARRIWERLAGQGVARIEQPFEPDGTGKFNGAYVIDAVK